MYALYDCLNIRLSHELWNANISRNKCDNNDCNGRLLTAIPHQRWPSSMRLNCFLATFRYPPYPAAATTAATARVLSP